MMVIGIGYLFPIAAIWAAFDYWKASEWQLEGFFRYRLGRPGFGNIFLQTI